MGKKKERQDNKCAYAIISISLLYKYDDIESKKSVNPTDKHWKREFNIIFTWNAYILYVDRFIVYQFVYFTKGIIVLTFVEKSHCSTTETWNMDIFWNFARSSIDT